MRRKYKATTYQLNGETKEIEFEAETSSNEPREKVLELIKSGGIVGNTFLSVFIPIGDVQFISKWHGKWKEVSYFPWAFFNNLAEKT